MISALHFLPIIMIKFSRTAIKCAYDGQATEDQELFHSEKNPPEVTQFRDLFHIGHSASICINLTTQHMFHLTIMSVIVIKN